MNRDLAEAKRAKMAAEQAVIRMDGRLRHKLKPHVKQGLINAILKSDAQDDLLFRATPARFTPSAWSITGLLSRLALIWNRRHNRGTAEDQRAALAQMHSRVRQSGAVALVIAFGVALFLGATELGEPLELGGQILRDSTRTMSASGNIVIVAKDDRSAKQLGALPWPRRYDAALIDKLREMGAKTIAMDDGFTSMTNQTDDAALAGAFDRFGGKVWLNTIIERDGVTDKLFPDVQAPLFRTRTQQAHLMYWYNLFGQIRYLPESIKIRDVSSRSLAEILADKGLISGYDTHDFEMRPRINDISNFFSTGELRPDFAIDFRTIPTISAIDIIKGNVDRSAIAGKIIMIGKTDETFATTTAIPWYGRVPVVYSLVVVAETIKNGIQRGMGYLPLLITAALIGAFCATRRMRRSRGAILGIGGVMLIIATLVGDRVGLHFQIIPALFLLTTLGIRQAMYGKLMIAETTNSISGLPNLSQIHYIKGREACAVGALKIEQYGEFVAPLSHEAERIAINGVAARINIMCPGSVIHQGDDGLFAWLIPLDSGCDFDVVGGQINALFMVPFVGLYKMQDIGVSVGVINDMKLNFGQRLAVAIDRANVPVYVTLREVL